MRAMHYSAESLSLVLFRLSEERRGDAGRVHALKDALGGEIFLPSDNSSEYA